MSIPSFTLQQGQEGLTPDQELEAQAFARERIEKHLSTEPANEQEAEAFLRQAYRAAHLAEPATIEWLDGPLQLVERFVMPHALPSQWPSVFDSVGDVIVDKVQARVRKSVDAALPTSTQTSVWNSVGARVIAGLRDPVGECIRAQVTAEVWGSLRESVFLHLARSRRDRVLQRGC